MRLYEGNRGMEQRKEGEEMRSSWCWHCVLIPVDVVLNQVAILQSVVKSNNGSIHSHIALGDWCSLKTMFTLHYCVLIVFMCSRCTILCGKYSSTILHITIIIHSFTHDDQGSLENVLTAIIFLLSFILITNWMKMTMKTMGELIHDTAF